MRRAYKRRAASTDLSPLREAYRIFDAKQMAIADIITVSEATIVDWRSGKKEPTLRKFDEFVRAIGCRVVIMPEAADE